MNNDLFLTVIRHDGGHHVQASDRTNEWRHSQPFRFRDDAWGFLREIKAGLETGRDLNLARWECTR